MLGFFLKLRSFRDYLWQGKQCKQVSAKECSFVNFICDIICFKLSR